MATNDRVLLDALVDKSKSRLGENLPDDQLFELFALEQALKERALSYDDLQVGWVEAGHDGGIDGFYVFVDDHLASADEIPKAFRQSPTIEIVICTIKHRESFQQAPLDQLLSSLLDLLDLSKTDEVLAYPYNESVLEARDVFRRAVLDHAEKRFRFTARIIYACRGAVDHVGSDLRARAQSIEAAIRTLVGETETSMVEFLGASELLDRARRQPDYSLSLPFIETSLSRGKTDYIVLCRLRDYFAFVCNEDGSLRRHLFESNVRDYTGSLAAVNRGIVATLASAGEPVDFWWLNNGITLTASAARTVGKEIYLDNVQIVNGLQTTESIHDWYSFLRLTGRRAEVDADERAILVKIVVSTDRATLDRIIRATNSQAPVDPAYLHATDKIQRDIEQYLEAQGWYYERRSNHWQNQGVPADRIVLPRQLAKWVRAVALRDPLRNEDIYRRVFDTSWPLDVFLGVILVTKGIERMARNRQVREANFDLAHVIKGLPFATALYVALTLGRAKWGPEEIMPLATRLDEGRAVEALHSVSSHVASYRNGGKTKVKRIVKRASFYWDLLNRHGLVGVPVEPALETDLE